MYLPPDSVSRPQKLFHVVGRQGAPSRKTTEQLYRKERKDQNFGEVDQVWFRGSGPRGGRRRRDQNQVDGDVPQEAGGVEEDLVSQWGWLYELNLGEPQQPQEPTGDGREGSRVQKPEMMMCQIRISWLWSLSRALHIPFLGLLGVHLFEFFPEPNLLLE